MKNKTSTYLLSALISIFVIIILLITSVQIVCYYSPNYYKSEFLKYNVDKTLKINIDDLVKVNNEMMDYLIDKKDNLEDIKTTINDQENTPFFNEREILHMKDVKNLFTYARKIRISLLVISMIILIYLFKVEKILVKVLLKAFSSVIMIISIVFVGLSLLVSTDFLKYFVVFHKIFFTNDLWILDPNTDNLINLVPLEFFIDTSGRIAILFVSMLLILYLVLLILHKYIKNKIHTK